MKKADAILIQKILEQCKYIKWKNVENFDDLSKEKEDKNELFARN